MPRKYTHDDCDHPTTKAARYACNKGPESLSRFIANMDPTEQAAIAEQERERGRERQACLRRGEEFRKRESEYKREYYRQNRDEVLARIREYNRRPEIHERRREYKAQNRERERERERERDRIPENREKKRARMTAKNIKRRRAKANTTVEPIFNEEIFERDNWVCQLCFEEVDPLLFYPHPESASLDHIVPLSLGGTHTEDNVQLAHLFCNISKGGKNRVKEVAL